MVHPYLEYFFATGRKIHRHYFLDLCALFSYAQEGGRKRVRVSVLGAGPAGSTAAYYLARQGVEVELLDRASFPRDKPCAGGLFNPLLYEREFPHLRTLSGATLYRVRFSGGNAAFGWESDQPLVKTVLREEFDHFLLNQAVAEGAHFVQNGNPIGTVLIDARGVQPPKNYRAAGICLVSDLKTSRDFDTVHIDYCFGGIMGYAWAFPKRGYVNVGLGAYLPQRNIRGIYDLYIDTLRGRGIISSCAGICRAKIIPFSPAKRIFTDDTLVVGDAAGFVRPATGEGIFFAMLSGRIAAQTIIEQHAFSWYEQRCRESFGRFLKPTRFRWSRSLLRRTLETAVHIGSRDKDFARLLVENFFRVQDHRLGGQFIRRLFR